MSEKSWVDFRLAEMYEILISLKYPLRLLKNAVIKSANHIPINSQTHSGNQSIVPFNCSSKDKFFNNSILSLKMFYESKLQIKIYKIPKRQTNILTYLNSNKQKTSFKIEKCNHKQCLLCPVMKCYVNSFYICDNNIILNGNGNCDTSFCIYMLTCGSCSHFYIGKSQSKLKIRFNLHRHDYKEALIHTASSLPLYQHLVSCCKSNYSVTIIYVEKEKSPLKLLFAEKYFILLLKPPLNVLMSRVTF